METRRIVLMGAMNEEVEGFREAFSNEFSNLDILVYQCGVGKPAAAAATQKIISKYNPNFLIFTGVAASLHPDLCIGDIGLGVFAIDSDIDVRRWDPTYQVGELPFTRQRVYSSDSSLALSAREAKISEKLFDAYIASGSKFLDANGKRDFLSCVEDLRHGEKIPNVYDMESSAVLQVANQNSIPCLVLRTISDDLEGNAAQDFNRFITTAVENYMPVLKSVLNNLNVNSFVV